MNYSSRQKPGERQTNQNVENIGTNRIRDCHIALPWDEKVRYTEITRSYQCVDYQIFTMSMMSLCFTDRKCLRKKVNMFDRHLQTTPNYYVLWEEKHGVYLIVQGVSRQTGQKETT